MKKLYPVLREEMRKRGLLQKDLSGLLGFVDSGPVSYRMVGKVAFKCDEAIAIHKAFFPDVDIKELFARGDGK